MLLLMKSKLYFYTKNKIVANDAIVKGFLSNMRKHIQFAI